MTRITKYLTIFTLTILCITIFIPIAHNLSKLPYRERYTYGCFLEYHEYSYVEAYAEKDTIVSWRFRAYDSAFIEVMAMNEVQFIAFQNGEYSDYILLDSSGYWLVKNGEFVIPSTDMWYIVFQKGRWAGESAYLLYDVEFSTYQGYVSQYNLNSIFILIISVLGLAFITSGLVLGHKYHKFDKIYPDKLDNLDLHNFLPNRTY